MEQHQRADRDPGRAKASRRPQRRPAAFAAAGLLAGALALALAAAGLAAAVPGEVQWTYQPLAESLATPPLPPTEVYPVQLVLDDDGAEGSLGLAGGQGARQFLWFNRFAQPAGPGFDLEEIWVLFPPDPNIAPGDAVQLAVYLDPDGDPTNGADLLATVAETVQVADGVTFSVYPLAAPLVIRDPGDVLIGVVPRFIQPGDPATSPAAIDQTASQGRSWLAIWSGDPPDPPTLPPDSLIIRVDDLAPSFPGNWMIRGFGIGPPVQEIPALEGPGLIGLAALLLLAGLVLLLRRRRVGAEG